VASDFSLEGGMIPRAATRAIDERGELRHAALSGTAVLEYRGRRHVIRLVNVSSSGAMVIFPYVPHIGETVRIQLVDRNSMAAQVIWARDGRVGLSFADGVE
jgi:methyl-accepting chemotaxis protein